MKGKIVAFVLTVIAVVCTLFAITSVQDNLTKLVLLTGFLVSFYWVVSYVLEKAGY